MSTPKENSSSTTSSAPKPNNSDADLHPHPHHKHTDKPISHAQHNEHPNSGTTQRYLTNRLPYVSGHISTHDDDNKIVVDASDIAIDQKRRDSSVSKEPTGGDDSGEQKKPSGDGGELTTAAPVGEISKGALLYQFLLDESWINGTWKGFLDDVLSAITITMTAVPTSVAFGLLGKMNPLQSLYTSFWFCLIISIFGGRPGIVPGNAGALTVLYPTLVGRYGPEPLYMASILAGVVFMIPGFVGVAKYIKLLPASVMIGFVDGLGFILARGQISAFKDENDNYLTGERAGYTAMLTIIGFIIMFGLPYLTKAIPSTFVAIAVGTAIEHIFKLGTVTVGDLYDLSGSFPVPRAPSVDWSNSEIVSEILTLTFIIPIIGLVESLLMVHVINVLTETKGSFERESIAMGAANIVSALWGGYAGCSIVGLTILNFHSGGGYRRMATFIVAILMIAIVLGAWRVINLFPMGSLSAALFGIAVKSFDLRSIDMMFSMKIPVSDSLIIISTVIASVFVDLAVGVGVGLVVALIFFAWDIFKNNGFNVRAVEIEEYLGDDDRIGGDEKKRVRACVLKLEGILFFFSASEALAKLEEIHYEGRDRDCSDIILDFGNGECTIRDYSVIDALNEIATIFTRRGRRFHLRNLDITSTIISERAREFAAEVHNDKDGVFGNECIVVLEKEAEELEEEEKKRKEEEDSEIVIPQATEEDPIVGIRKAFEEDIKKHMSIVVYVHCENLGVNIPLHPFSLSEFGSTTKFTEEQKLAHLENVSFRGHGYDAILKEKNKEMIDQILEMLQREVTK